MDKATGGFGVVVCPATRRDGVAATTIFAAAQISCEVVPTLPDVARKIREQPGVLLLTDLALPASGFDELVDAINMQPTWSDIPVVLMAASGLSAAVQQATARLSNVTVVDRPASTRTILNTVQAALRARKRQYQMRDQLEVIANTENALRAADRSKDEFLATLAHELRNPLAPLRSAHQVLTLKGRDADPQSSKMLGVMDRQLRVMVRLIDDLLDIARISSGKVILQPKIVDVREVVELAIEACRPGISAAHHSLEVDLGDAPLMVNADPTRIAQVVGNLLNNAVKYTQDGGEITVSVSASDGAVAIAVKDNGEGIPPALLSKVFDMFAQVNQTLDRAQGGLGIGLALVRKILEMHGGRVRAVSAGAKSGSEFSVTLPLIVNAIDSSTDAGEEQRSSDKSGALSILVVDDNRDAADTLALLLTIRGHKVAVEYSGAAAIATAERISPVVVFSDIGMPEVDGHAVAKSLAMKSGKSRPVLAAVTGWGSEDDRRLSKDAGFDFHLTKPLTDEGLDAVLGSALIAARSHANK